MDITIEELDNLVKEKFPELIKNDFNQYYSNEDDIFFVFQLDGDNLLFAKKDREYEMTSLKLFDSKEKIENRIKDAIENHRNWEWEIYE